MQIKYKKYKVETKLRTVSETLTYELKKYQSSIMHIIFKDNNWNKCMTQLSANRKIRNPAVAGFVKLLLGIFILFLILFILYLKYKKQESFTRIMGGYLKTFENILHINLIKYREVPIYNNKENHIRFFIEIETIEGTSQNTGVFAYYYGFIDLRNEENQYKIADINFYGENFLCAPYHGWYWDAEANVQIRYGDWCNLIKDGIQTKHKDYVINILFEGTDEYDYCIVFYRLTNGTDLEIAACRKKDKGNWILIQMNPENCLKYKK